MKDFLRYPVARKNKYTKFFKFFYDSAMNRVLAVEFYENERPVSSKRKVFGVEWVAISAYSYFDNKTCLNLYVYDSYLYEVCEEISPDKAWEIDQRVVEFLLSRFGKMSVHEAMFYCEFYS